MKKQLFLVVALIAATIAFSAQPASALSCGATIRASTTITTNMTCPDIAFMVDSQTSGKPITLNLNGKTITSTGEAAIVVRGGTEAPITLKRGTVANSPRYGVLFESGSLVVSAVTFTANAWALDTGPNDNTVSLDVAGSTFDRNSSGITTWETGTTNITSSTFTNTSRAALMIYGFDYTVTGSTFKNNRRGVITIDHDGVSGNLKLIGNHFERNKVAVEVLADDNGNQGNVIAGNSFLDNGGGGILIDQGGSHSDGLNTIVGNTFTSNGARPDPSTQIRGAVFVSTGASPAPLVIGSNRFVDNVGGVEVWGGGTVIDGGYNRAATSPCVGFPC